MTHSCTNCGEPVDHAETHHVDQQRGNNHPDNLTSRCRRCHMAHHDNDRAADGYSIRQYGPRRPATDPPR